MMYFRFLLMILVSMIAMYLVMYLNSYSFDHAHWSETRLFMTLLMGSTMAVVMLSFMQSMYKNRITNLSIYIGAIVIFAASLYLVRSQQTVEDQSWMSAMIPHHSIAVLTSERAQLSDPRVKELANKIIESQNKEILEMKWLLEDIRTNGIAKSSEKKDRAVPHFEPENQQR